MLALLLALTLTAPVQGWFLHYHEYGTNRYNWRGPYASEDACQDAGRGLPGGYGWSCEWEKR